jgi:hypothetical protein
MIPKFHIERAKSRYAILIYLTEQQMAPSNIENGNQIFCEQIYRAIQEFFPSSDSAADQIVSMIRSLLFPSKRWLWKSVEQGNNVRSYSWGSDSQVTVTIKLNRETRTLRYQYVSTPSADYNYSSGPVENESLKNLTNVLTEQDQQKTLVPQIGQNILVTLHGLQRHIDKLRSRKLSVEQQFDLERLADACRTVDRLLIELSQNDSPENLQQETILTAEKSLAQIGSSVSSLEKELSEDILREMKVLQIYLNMRKNSLEIE